MRLVYFAVAASFLLLVAPSFAQEDYQSPSAFSRETIDKVDHSLVALWIMMTSSGVNDPGSICSGVIFQSVPEENAAYLLTNHHCVNNNSLWQVELWDKTTYVARLVGSEPGIDTAVLRIENIPPDAYEVCVLGDSDALKIGEPVIAMGAPGYGPSSNTNRTDPYSTFGLHSTATLGVVIGKSTEATEFVGFWAGWKSGLGQQVMTNVPWHMVVQAGINGGNSGGPSFNSKGECIGLNHAHRGGSTQVLQNMNWTIPINLSKNFAFQIIETGKYELPWFGMDILLPQRFENYTSISSFYDRHYDAAVLKVHGIRRNSPAEDSGLEVGDIITEFDGQFFPTVSDLRLYIFSLPIGKEVPVTVQRGKRKVDLNLTVGVKRNYDSEFSF